MATVSKRHWTTEKGEEREAWVLAFTDADGNRKKLQFAKKKEADAKRIEVEGLISKGAYRALASSSTVDDACRDYLKHLRGRRDRGERVTEHYYRTTEAQLLNYVSPQPDRKADIEFDGGIGSIKLSQCTARVVADFRDRLRDIDTGVVTTRRILGSLSRALGYAVENDLLASNPARGVRVIGTRDQGPKKVMPPSKLDLSLALKSATGSLAVRMRLSASAGLRASELYALRWRNISFNAGELVVDARVDAYGNLDTTKSTAGKRTVPLSAPMLKELRAWRDAAKKKEADDLVFPNSRGGYLGHHNVLKREVRPLMAAIADKAKADKLKFKTFNWHALRHFAISTWIEAGLPPKTVQTYAGHSSLQVTMDRYGHMFPNEDHRAVMDQIAAGIFA